MRALTKTLQPLLPEFERDADCVRALIIVSPT